MKDKSTYKYPRTMQEAFGPYTDHNLVAMDEKIDNLVPWVVWAVIVVVLVASYILWG